MSNEENAEQQTEQPAVDVAKPKAATAESPADKAGNIVATLLQLKETNPKVFFGAIGVVVVLLLILMMSGGETPKPVSGLTLKNLTVGQKYELKSPNSIDPSATVRLVSAPSTQAYDDTEVADRNTPCQHMPQGTSVSVVEIQDVSGAKFAKVQIETGDCKGRDGWVSAIDVQ